MASKDSQNSKFVDNFDFELYILILKYLDDGPCKSASKILKNELSKLWILPKRFDWKGRGHDISIDSLISRYDYLPNKYLHQICSNIIPLVNKNVPVGFPKVSSLLGVGNHSIIRQENDYKIISFPRSIHSLLQHGACKTQPNCSQFPSNFVDVLKGRELCGHSHYSTCVSPHIYQKISLMFRTLGHLSSVYCVTFDQTGNFIFTGSDDHLVKVWSVLSGRLLYTYRGHSGEITDIAISHNNSLLATGSCDKLVRVWSLSNTSPIAVLHAHTHMITSIKFSPYTKNDINLLISTGGDGCLCIWEYNCLTHFFNSKPIKFIERSRAGTQMLCSSFSPGGAFLATGSSDNVIRVFRINGSIPEKICELEAHENPIDTIIYANHSTRFVSGSKDGIARVWRYEGHEWRATMLNMNEKMANKGGSASPRTSLQVTMVCWSCDDTYIITAANDFSIKVWLASDGHLFQELLGHTDEAYVLENNPVDGRVVLSAGHDGNIFVWNIVSGTKLCSFKNTIEGQGHGSLFDCKWTPDGLSFAGTDAHGHLLFFSTGSNNRYKKVPEQLYFHTDYRPLIRDVHDNVIDEQTEEPPHFMPPPFLVDVDGAPYPPHLQRLVPGRETNTDTQLVPLVVVLPDGTREVLDAMPASEEGQLINEMISQMQHQQDEMLQRRPTAPPNHHPPPNIDPEDEEQPGREVGQDVRVFDYEQRACRLNQSFWSKRVLVPPISASIQKQNTDRAEELAEEELRDFLKEKQKKATFFHDESSNDSYYAMRRRLKHGIERGRLNKQTKEEKRRNRLERRALYDTDASQQPSDMDVQDEHQTLTENKKPTFSESETVESDSSFSDWAPTTHLAKTMTGRMARQKRHTRAQRRMHTSTTSTNSPSSSSSVDSETESESGKSVEKMDKPDDLEVVNNRGKKSRQKSKPAVKMDEDEDKESIASTTNMIVPPEFRPVDWLTIVAPRKNPYFPQEGDEVMYMMQGHQQYVEAVISKNIYDLDPDDPVLPWNRKPALREQELLRVLHVDHVINPPRLISLQLVIIDPDTGRPVSSQFNIKYHDMTGVIDFFILRTQYETAMQRNWNTGNRFRCIIEDTWWHGSIMSHEPFQEEHADSMFQCFNVKWDNDETEKLSPWDLEPIDNKRLPNTRAGSVQVTVGEWANMRSPFKLDEWPEPGPYVECQRLLSGLEEIMSLSISEPFLVPVDLNTFPMYAMVIAYPIDLNTIKQRIHHKFYRRPAAILSDVHWIETNAMKFNRPQSHIVKQARLVVDLCLRFVNDTDCDNVMHIYERLVRNSVSATTSSAPDHRQEVSNDEMNYTVKQKPGRKKASVNWKKECLHILQTVSKSGDAVPFRSPAKCDELPDYTKIVERPMDLSTVANKLRSGLYAFFDDFVADMRLIFSNSKLYNTNKRSKIYVMTLRVSAMFDHLLSEVTSKLAASDNSSKSISSSRMNSEVRHSAWKHAPSTRKQVATLSPPSKKRRLKLESSVEDVHATDDAELQTSPLADESTNHSDTTSDEDYNDKPNRNKIRTIKNIKNSKRTGKRHKHEKKQRYETRCITGHLKQKRYEVEFDDTQPEVSSKKNKHKRQKVDDADYKHYYTSTKKYKKMGMRKKYRYKRNLESVDDDDDSGVLVQRQSGSRRSRSVVQRRTLNTRLQNQDESTRHFDSIASHSLRSSKRDASREDEVFVGARILRSKRVVAETETSNDVPEVAYSRKRLRSVQQKKATKIIHSDTESYNSDASKTEDTKENYTHASFSNFRKKSIELKKAEHEHRYAEARRMVTRRSTVHCESSNDAPHMSSRGRLYKSNKTDHHF